MEMVLKQFEFEDSCFKVIGRVTYENVRVNFKISNLHLLFHFKIYAVHDIYLGLTGVLERHFLKMYSQIYFLFFIK